MSDITVSSAAQLALAKLLAKLNLIETSALPRNFSKQDTFPIAHFAQQGLFEETDALEIVAKALGMPVFSFEPNTLTRCIGLLDNPLFSKIPLSKWKDLRAVPYEILDGRVSIAMANPLDHETKGALEFDLACQVQIGISKESEILAVVSKRIHANTNEDLDKLRTQSDKIDHATEAQNLESNVLSSDLDTAPVIRLVNKVFSDAVQSGASDIHISPEKEDLVVRYRIDGIMRDALVLPNSVKNGVISRIKLLCSMDISERRKPQDGRLRIKTSEGSKDLRVSTVPTIHGENVVARILSSDVTRVDFASLGMSQEMERIMKRALKGSSRVILVTGPTGSGKTSSLYASLLHLKDGQTNIITVEDPIEYRIQGVNQIQVNPKVGLTFAEGLRSILRQDPDVIMIGEIRDNETASIAMQVAQTGHLVLSTLHTNSAAAAITRLKDLGIAPYLIASSLGCVLAQRLVRQLCSECSEPATGEHLERCVEVGICADKIRQSKGCPKCGNTGYSGRVGVFSVLEVTDKVREAIREDKGEILIEECAREAEFVSLEEAGRDLVTRGVTSIDELERILGALTNVKPAKPSLNDLPKTTGIELRRILLVEDDENTRHIISMLLENEMYEVDVAADGNEALKKIYERPPSLIISDVMMPRMNGHELVRRIRGDSRTRDIPVLMLTAISTEDREVSLIEGGADDFVSKTSDAKIMLARVRRLLERTTN